MGFFNRNSKAETPKIFTAADVKVAALKQAERISTPETRCNAMMQSPEMKKLIVDAVNEMLGKEIELIKSGVESIFDKNGNSTCLHVHLRPEWGEYESVYSTCREFRYVMRMGSSYWTDAPWVRVWSAKFECFGDPTWGDIIAKLGYDGRREAYDDMAKTIAYVLETEFSGKRGFTYNKECTTYGCSLDRSNLFSEKGYEFHLSLSDEMIAEIADAFISTVDEDPLPVETTLNGKPWGAAA